ncbi:MAG: cytochrome c peroxidase [Sediminibacterium sp.]|uniref:cytochrome c peroxidase n=1 Tax=Sediminibacterium sp. TaxID=1917865 RepID=UPI00271D6B2F|nr:cytochrome c peroxidase [Sediminibacterium sp.]MDO8995152.1 cytochrome c peroxidase [Sediminibacterium sp.]
MQQKQQIIGLIIAAVCVGFLLIHPKSTAKQSVDKARANLGRHLFYDTQLSYNLTKSCVSCHDPKMAFTDGYRTSSGADGFNVKHNAISLLNVKYRTQYTWANTAINSLQKQIQFPFFNEHPTELGWKGQEQFILNRFAANTNYQYLFRLAFPDQKMPFTIGNIQQAIIAFEEQLVSFNAPYDLYNKGNLKVLNEQAVAGMKLFNSNKLGCAKCHSWEQPFEKYESQFSAGIRIPSLRNVMLTAPYMHDGSLENIFDVLSYYDRKNSLNLSAKEQQSLIAFFTALTDTSYLSNKEFLNPFQYQ